MSFAMTTFRPDERAIVKAHCDSRKERERSAHVRLAQVERALANRKKRQFSNYQFIGNSCRSPSTLPIIRQPPTHSPQPHRCPSLRFSPLFSSTESNRFRSRKPTAEFAAMMVANAMPASGGGRGGGRRENESVGGREGGGGDGGQGRRQSSQLNSILYKLFFL